jgi:hypothetical protein
LLTNTLSHRVPDGCCWWRALAIAVAAHTPPHAADINHMVPLDFGFSEDKKMGVAVGTIRMADEFAVVGGERFAGGACAQTCCI